MTNPRQDLSTRLADILQRETALLTVLVEQATEQQEALTAMDTARLERSCKLQADSTQQLRSLERERVAMIATEFRIPLRNAGNVNLRALINVATNEEDRRLLLGLRDNLRRLTVRWQELCRFNRILTERARRFAKETLNVLTNDGQPIINARM